MPSTCRFKVEKLVRSNVPESLESKGIVVTKKILDDEAYLKALRDKLVEEAKEVFEAQDMESLKEELADVLEVILALSKALSIPMEEIETTRSQKNLNKGGFDKKLYVYFMDIARDNPEIEYCFRNLSQYPVIDQSES